MLNALEIDSETLESWEEAATRRGMPLKDFVVSVVDKASNGVAPARIDSSMLGTVDTSKSDVLSIVFRVYGDIALAANRELTPFGHTCGVFLISGSSQSMREGHRSLVAIQFSYELGNRYDPSSLQYDANYVRDFKKLHEYAWRATPLLSYVVALLRLRGHHSLEFYDHFKHGAHSMLRFLHHPQQRVTRLHPADGWRAKLFAPPSRPVCIPPELPARLFSQRQVEASLIAEDRIFRVADYVRRLMLVVEGRFPRPQRVGESRPRVHNGLINLVRRLQPQLDASNFAASLQQVRDDVSHLKRVEVDRPFGMATFDYDMMRRLDDMLPILQSIAWEIFAGGIEDLPADFGGRFEPSATSIAANLNRDAEIPSQHRDATASKIFTKIVDEFSRDKEIELFLSEELERLFMKTEPVSYQVTRLFHAFLVQRPRWAIAEMKKYGDVLLTRLVAEVHHVKSMLPESERLALVEYLNTEVDSESGDDLLAELG